MKKMMEEAKLEVIRVETDIITTSNNTGIATGGADGSGAQGQE
jgi:hypothetical protein